jgi:hypothetical protein
MTLDLVVTRDQAFAQHLGVTRCSLADSNRGQPIRVFVLADLSDATYVAVEDRGFFDHRMRS